MDGSFSYVPCYSVIGLSWQEAKLSENLSLSINKEFTIQYFGGKG